MLRLERDRKQRQIRVFFTPKERFANRPFLFAILIATGLHAIFFIFFKVAPLFTNFSESTHLPVSVAMDFTAFNNPLEKVTHTEIEERRLARRILLEPKPSEVRFPQLEQGSYAFSVRSPLSGISLLPSTRELSERNTFALSDNEFALMTTYPKLTIKLSGNLADKQVSDIGSKDVYEMIEAPLSEIRWVRVSFEVLVENSSGRILWFKSISSLVDKEFNKKIDGIVQNIRFTSEPVRSFTRGFIELTMMYI